MKLGMGTIEHQMAGVKKNKKFPNFNLGILEMSNL